MAASLAYACPHPPAKTVTATAGWQDTRQEARDRQAHMFSKLTQAGKITMFRSFGVQVIDGDDHVYTIGAHDGALKGNNSRILGTLARAQAMVTDGAQAWSPGKALLMPIALTALANALAGTTSPATAPQDGNEPAARLRTLKELLDADLISQQEYDTRRTDIINSI